ncbi:MAG: cbb3-type cytochrome c oxidase subunit II [Chloroflexota bacterium]|nr:cbb3-type cytochrome c oxidase subunit II [Chloroflexota bacterium]
MFERLERSALAIAAGALALLVVATGVVAVAPPLVDPTMHEPGPDPRAVTDLPAVGQQVYVREGCQNCHTQLVRAVPADTSLGPVTAPGDPTYQAPSLLGTVRIGPDLSCAANLFPEENTPEAMKSFLTDPGSIGSGSKMPSYGHLAEQDLEALTAYLLTRVCQGVERPTAQPSPGSSEQPNPLEQCPDAAEPGSGDVELTISAENIQFDTNRLEGAKDCEPFTIVFENREAAPHNVSIYADDTLAMVLFQEDPVAGPTTVRYEIPALPAGEYYFQCDVHPTMNGTLVVGGG